jgi:hypothetical protein
LKQDEFTELHTGHHGNDGGIFKTCLVSDHLKSPEIMVIPFLVSQSVIYQADSLAPSASLERGHALNPTTQDTAKTPQLPRIKFGVFPNPSQFPM